VRINKQDNKLGDMTLPKVKGKYKFDYSLAHLTWFKVGGKADILFKPEDKEDLAHFLQGKDKDLDVMVLGAGSNIIIRDGGIAGTVVKLGRSFTIIEEMKDGNLAVGAGCLNYNLAKFAKAKSIAGFEFLVGIPGTIGGGVAMNAGAYGSEFKDLVIYVEAIDKFGNFQKFSCEEMGFAYRKNSLPKDLIFTRVIFRAAAGDTTKIQQRMAEINKNRSESQPITEKTGGSTFANPEGHKAWELIDDAALRGYSIGGASMSTKHCNFMINDGEATAADMENLGEFVRKEVKKKSGIELKWEIKCVGRNGRV
jgi:UDP-N-acetylmuramate dehydrogenase